LYFHVQVLLKYFIPSFLYCLYNNLTFINLKLYDPTTYFLLLQFRVVVTGIIFQILFSKKLSKIQWFSLILLTIGCIIKQVGYSLLTSSTSTQSETKVDDQVDYFNAGLILILVQVFCSCFAGVYNEFLLKEKDNNVNIMLQNVFMYIDSIICNVVLLSLSSQSSNSGGLLDALSPTSLLQLLEIKVLLIMFNNAAIGIVTSLFLKSLNSILKTFASALELLFTGILSWIIFNIPLDMSTIIAIFIVSIAIWLYSKNPVNNIQPVASSSTSTDSKSQNEKLSNV